MADLADDLEWLEKESGVRRRAARQTAFAGESAERMLAEADRLDAIATRLRALIAKHEGSGCPGCGRTPDNPTPLACQICRRDPYR